MGYLTLTDVLANKKEGDEWYSFQLPEELHIWTLVNKWKKGVFKGYGSHLSSLSVGGEVDTHKTQRKCSNRTPMYLKCGVDIRAGCTVIKTTSTANFTFPADSSVEVNEILEELSNETGITVWAVKGMNLYVPGIREIFFKRHNPNGTGTSLYFFRLKDDQRNTLYPEVSLNEQQGLVSLMKIKLAHCTAVERKEMVHGCAIKVMQKKQGKKDSKQAKWFHLT